MEMNNDIFIPDMPIPEPVGSVSYTHLTLPTIA